ncbi:AAA family ATPase [Streptomyces cyaneofuscatus]|uniref:AAA family ATPase n=1 Tax=Streptomyces cyaneofuscatus TaxID=66883 RepID=UPI00379483F1
MLIAMAGLPGSGKSSVAGALGRKLTAPVVSVDPIEAAMWRAGVARDQPTGLAAYVVAEAVADDVLGMGQTVIVDAVNAGTLPGSAQTSSMRWGSVTVLVIWAATLTHGASPPGIGGTTLQVRGSDPPTKVALDTLERDLNRTARRRGACWQLVADSLGLATSSSAESRFVRLKHDAASHRYSQRQRAERARDRAADTRCHTNLARLREAVWGLAPSKTPGPDSPAWPPHRNSRPGGRNSTDPLSPPGSATCGVLADRLPDSATASNSLGTAAVRDEVLALLDELLAARHGSGPQSVRLLLENDVRLDAALEMSGLYLQDDPTEVQLWFKNCTSRAARARAVPARLSPRPADKQWTRAAFGPVSRCRATCGRVPAAARQGTPGRRRHEVQSGHR